MNIQRYPRSPILIVDDETDILNTYSHILKTNYINNFILCSDSREVMQLLNLNNVSVVLLDLFMPHIRGEELLGKIHEMYPAIPIIVITGSNNVETAVECMQGGTFDYLVKPVEKTRFLSSVRNAIDKWELEDEIQMLREKVFSRDLINPKVFENIITVNGVMFTIFKYIEAIAASNHAVLITGESGTGKELIARVIHTLSGREGQFVPVNAAGLDDAMFSDTLFGHKKGAFTGADNERKGLIEQAQSGTLFLDEIGDLDPQSQIKLLRLLQEKEYYKIGSDMVRITNARIISATSCDLNLKVNANQFRRELLYRLKTHWIHLPPLRERKEDIPLLVEYFWRKVHQDKISDTAFLSIEAMEMLINYQFPGNIRELEGIVNDVAATKSSESSDEDIILKHIGPTAVSADAPQEINPLLNLSTLDGRLPTLQSVEKFLIREALNRTSGNQSAAAAMLGISQPTMSRRLKELEA